MESGILDVTNDSCLLLVVKKESGIQSTCYQKEQQHSCERQFAFGFQMNPFLGMNTESISLYSPASDARFGLTILTHLGQIMTFGLVVHPLLME